MQEPTVTRYPCPCCGYRTFSGPPGGDEACPICFWEDDGTQLRWPRAEDGLNSVSLEQAQKNFAECGAAEESFKTAVRPLSESDEREPGWRPIGTEDSFEDAPSSAPGPDDPTSLYWWRSTYWRKS